MKRRFYTASSKQAWLDGCWPRKEWGVFDRELYRGELLFTAQTRKEACRWRDKHEAEVRKDHVVK